MDSLMSRLLGLLPGAKRGKGKNTWAARCPAHDDRHASLSVSAGEDGRALVHCHAGCSVEAICAAVGLKVADLFAQSPQPATEHRKARENGGLRRQDKEVEDNMTFSQAEDAVAELERQHGPRSATWTYADASGKPVGIVVRWDRPEGGKDIRPVSLKGESWIVGGMPEPRPLYRLPELAGAERVIVCEGEKAADAARSIGLAATTSPHGAQSAAKADWSPLAGKDVIVLPDNDEAGRKYADTVGGLLTKLNPPARVKVVELPRLPAHGDMVEWIEQCHGEAAEPQELCRQLDALIAAAPLYRLKLPSGVPAGYAPFPVQALPEPVGSFVREASKTIGCDPSFVALPLLAALASAIGNTRRIMLKAGWCEPSILWTAIVGQSGSHKTPAISAGTETLSHRQAEALGSYQSEMEDYERKKLAYEVALNEWKRNRAGTRGDPPEKPEEPVPKRWIVSDATVEALADRLAQAPRGLLLVRDELAGWLLSFDQYKSGKGGDSAHWLSLYNAKPLCIDRKTGDRKLLHVPVASVSIAGGIQPETLRRALGREHFENGLASRLLLAYPPRRPRRWTEATIDEGLRRRLEFVFEQLRLLDFERDATGESRPIDLALTPDAKATWIDFFNRHGGESADLVGDEAALWSKLEGTAPRLALITQLVRDPDSNAIDVESMAAGIVLADWFGAEGRRIYAMLDEGAEEQDRRELIEFIQQRGGGITMRELTRGPRRYRDDPAAADAALNDLLKRGLGRWVPQPAGPDGGRPTSCFVLFGCGDGDETTVSLGECEGSVTVAETEQIIANVDRRMAA